VYVTTGEDEDPMSILIPMELGSIVAHVRGSEKGPPIHAWMFMSTFNPESIVSWDFDSASHPPPPPFYDLDYAKKIITQDADDEELGRLRLMILEAFGAIPKRVRTRDPAGYSFMAQAFDVTLDMTCPEIEILMRCE
jgi:hypothetical protein